jgi:uroporphyrinogen III methyltransferase/synthase
VTTAIAYFIGAGPGDPGLITVRGLECLRRADVVIHDPGISPRLLARARSDAEVIDVGRSDADEPAAEAIGLLIADKVATGKVVARLKSGDPFLFDRGAEEALILERNGVSFEVVPGIPAGLAAPAYAGIAIGHSLLAEVVTVIRGCEDDHRALADVDWAGVARVHGTVVCYASPQQMPRMLDALRSHGCPADTPAAMIYNGTQPSQETITGTLAELASAAHEHHRRGPAVLVVGRAVSLRNHLRWFDARPLFGKRVLVTRPRDQAAELVDRLNALGAEAIESPMIAILPPDDPGPLLDAAANAGSFDCIVFTSANAVEAFMTALLDGSRDIRALKGPVLCAVGTATADRLSRYGIKVDLVPSEFRAEAVVSTLMAQRPVTSLHVLLPRADIGREVIATQLREAGAEVTEVIAYRTVLQEGPRANEPDIYGMLLDGRIDVVTFTSASAVRNFLKVYGSDQAVDLLNTTIVATIGPVTAETATQLGIRVEIQPTTYTIPAFVDAIAAFYARPA